MGSPQPAHALRVVDAALVRATVRAGLPELPPWPDTGTSPTAVTNWLAAVWASPSVVRAVAAASPVLASRVQDALAGAPLRPGQLRRMAVSLARYLVRMGGRATPFGLFAGIAPLRFGGETVVGLGGEEQVRLRADARWLAEVIVLLESNPEVRRRLPLVANNLALPWGDHLVLSSPPHASSVHRPAAKVLLRRTRAVELALQAAQSPITGGEAVEKLTAELPHLPAAALERVLAQLLECGVLISSLRPASTSDDGLAHVLSEVESIGAGVLDDVVPLYKELQRLHEEMTKTPAAAGPLRQRMRKLSGVVEQPVATDLRLGGTLTLPDQVADEVAAAADALVRSGPHPAGDARMDAFHARFVERYGTGAAVPVTDLVDSTAGLGFPPHYEHPDESSPSADPRLSHRDGHLLALAQQAALDGAREVELDEDLLGSLPGDTRARVRPVPHAQLCAEVHAPTQQAVNRGAFTLVVTGTGRSAAALTGRFLDLLPSSDRGRITDQMGELPTAVAGAVPVQLAFPPRHVRLENVAHAPYVLPHVLPLAEHRTPEAGQLRLEDLAVTADSERLYVLALPSGQVVEPVVANAAARRAWPPLARLLVEISRSATGGLSPWAWGAAGVLPFLPRVRYGRTVLAPARWLLPTTALPGREAAPSAWEEALDAVRERLSLPEWVSVGEGDRLLRLNLDEAMDRALLREHVDQAAAAGEVKVAIAEAAGPEAYGWAGGRAHEIVVPLAATTQPRPGPVRTAPTLIRRDHGTVPGQEVISAQLYGHPHHVDSVLTAHLPRLLAELGDPAPPWWFLRYRDPLPHLRLRLHPDSGMYGTTVEALGTWAAKLRQRCLIGDVQLGTYRPEIARYGTGAAMEAAEALFAADSGAVCAQLGTTAVPRRTLAVASMVNLTGAMTGGLEAGVRWLLDHRPATPGPRLPHEEVRQAARLADPTDDHAALRALIGGEQVADAWRKRQCTAADYAARLSGGAGPKPETVLISLLHLHHIRVLGIDPDSERLVERMARAVALAWHSCRSDEKREAP